jgi:hypothetical protein
MVSPCDRLCRVRAILAAAALIAATAGCDRLPRFRPAPRPGAEAADAWSPERIAGDPQGYLRNTDGQIGRQLEAARGRLSELQAKRAEVAGRAGSLVQQLDDARNVQARLKAAVRRAEDEDRWPARFAGRAFTREQAQGVIGNLDHFVAQQGPLADAYADAVRRIDGAQAAATRDIERLLALRERVALDLERVRLNQNLAEMAQWRQTEAEVAAMSASLAAVSPDALGELAGVGGETQQVISVDALLGPR